MERYVLRGGRWGYDRLQLLARVRRAHTLELLGLAGLRSGMRCVDLGCGGGEGPSSSRNWPVPADSWSASTWTK